jgi:hypothetical protein
MKQLVLMHGVPSDVKVSSVVDETSIKESRDYESITARRFSWKIDPDSSAIPGEPRATDDSSGAHAPEVRHVSLYSCADFLRRNMLFSFVILNYISDLFRRHGRNSQILFGNMICCA